MTLEAGSFYCTSCGNVKKDDAKADSVTIGGRCMCKSCEAQMKARKKNEAMRNKQARHRAKRYREGRIDSFLDLVKDKK